MRLSIRLLSLLAVPSILQIFSFTLLGNLEEHAQKQLRIAENARATSTALDLLLNDVYQVLKQHSNERDLELDAIDPSFIPSGLRQLDLDMERLERLTENDEKYAAEIGELRSSVLRIASDYSELIRNFATKRDAGFLERKRMWSVLGKDAHKVTDRTSNLVAREKAIQDEAAKNQQNDSNATKVILYVAALFSCLSILTVSFLVMRGIVSKINVLVENTKLLVNDKNLNEPLTGSDELSLLDQTFHEMAESIRDANYRERAVLYNALDAILVLDEGLQIIKCNPATTKLFRTPERELKRLSIERFIQKDDVSLFRDYFFKARRFSSQPPLEIQIRQPQLPSRHTHWTVRWSEHDGQFFCVAHDLTDRIAAEKLRDEAISMLNHDLRSPLTSIQLTFDLITETLKSGHDIAAVHALVQRGGHNCSRVLALTNELLDWDKYRSGQVKLRRSKCDLAQIILFAGETLEPQFKTKSIDFVADLDSIFVDADGVELERVVLNLLSNSIKFSPANCELRVESCIQGDFGQVCIRDQGPGIDSTKLDKIFDRYFQLEQQRNEGEGAGLGLAICRLIVEMHGGKIWAQSKLGHGSEFFFQIPLYQENNRGKING
ncbi:MAG: ATP-binding protein [Candidatus Obscuribacterales bacterium]|nr:ATP-binding protein [Candidatus Obscuribacterales bacterium]